jgi:preprotein translocase subunit SecF
MELFHEPKIDWMGKKRYFITLSLLLALTGLISIAVHRGLAYGIDFRGGTLVYVKFAKAPDLDGIRRELDRKGLRGPTIQWYGPQSDKRVIIGLDLRTTSAEALDAGKNAIVSALAGIYGAGPSGKIDFNDASPQTVSERLMIADPLLLASKRSDVATKTYKDLAEEIVRFRNSPPRSGLITDFQELRSLPGVTQGVLSALSNDFYLSSFAVFNTEIVGPKVGADLRRQALYVTLSGLGAMLVYIWFRFELIYGVAAVIATFHDVIITLGIFSLLNNKEITLTVIAGLLTLVGYSMNDTIVVFDRIRENVRLKKREGFTDLVNRSINQTLSRTMLTSGLTFLAVLSLFLFGGEVLRGFSLVLVVGVIVGTYSSIFIASPVVVFWQQRYGKGRVPERPRVYEREPAGARR